MGGPWLGSGGGWEPGSAAPRHRSTPGGQGKSGDVATGKEIWRTPREEVCGWGTPTIDDSTERHQLVLNGYKHIGGYDLATGKELWKTKNGGDIPVPTPIVYGDLFYGCRDNGIVSCIDAKTGERHYRQRLTSNGSGFTASGVATDGEIYVLQAGTKFETLAINELGETCMASPAISKGTLNFRTRSHLIAVQLPPAKPGRKPVR